MSKLFNIVCLGAGNLAYHLVPALHDLNCNIVQVYSRTLKSSSLLANKVGAEAITDIKEIYSKADIYLVMLKDDVIEEVIMRLPKLNNHQILAHTSGATKTSFLNKRALSHGSFYPLQTFRKRIMTDISNVPFLIYGSNFYAERQLRILARQLSRSVTICNDKQRLQYHMAAVIRNNFINHLACLSNNFLEKNDLDPKILEAITRQTILRILDENPCDIQTGPAIRNDENVITKHLNLIGKDKSLTEIYMSLTKSIQKEYEK